MAATHVADVGAGYDEEGQSDPWVGRHAEQRQRCAPGGGRIRAAAGDEAGLNGDQPQNTGGRKPLEEGLECKEERTHGLPADREQIELPAVHAVHAVWTQSAVRIAATFWLSAAWVRWTDSATSVMVMGPQAWSRSRSSSMTKPDLSLSICCSEWIRAISASIDAWSRRKGRQRLCRLRPRFRTTPDELAPHEAT